MRATVRTGGETACSIVLEAETDAERLVVEALRRGTARLMPHGILQDGDYEGLVRDSAQADLDAAHLGAVFTENREEQRCLEHHSVFGSEKVSKRECPKCQTAAEMARVGGVVEVEVEIRCDCWPGCEGSPSFDRRVGHVKSCPAPRAAALGLKVAR